MSARHEPRVSVVVPIYDVEPYLHDCLESLARQTMRDLEVVMVDDGSTDRSAQVAASFADRDPRFVLVQQENGGLGHARNTGADRATGSYLAFVDSDDVVRPDAYELLAGSLDRTGSDFATGNVHRLTTSGTRQAGVVATGFSANRPRTHIRKHPALLYDRTAWNKLYRRSFWDQNGFRWPEGVLYEDIPVTLPAHVLARSVDVIRDPVYLWRQRAGESASITQRRTELRAVRDRFTAVDGVSRFMAAHGEIRLKRLYDRSVAEQDLFYFLDELDRADEQFREEFLRLANDFFDRAEPTVFDGLPALQRLEWHLVRRSRLPELLEVIEFAKSGQVVRNRWVRQGRTIYGGYPFRGDPRLGIPDDVYRITKDEIPVVARVERVWWDGDVIRLSGYAFIAFVPVAHEREGRVSLTLEEAGHAVSVLALDVRRVSRPDITALHSPDGASYEWSGWEASVPAAALRHGGGFRAGSWRLRLELHGRGVTRREWLSATDPGPARRPGWRFLDGALVVPTTESGRFAVEVVTTYAAVEAVRRAEPHGLELSGVVSGVPTTAGTAVLAVPSNGSSPLRFDVDWTPGAHDFTSRLDLTRFDAGPGTGAAWDLYLDPGEGRSRVPLSAARALDSRSPVGPGGCEELRLRMAPTSRLRIERGRRRPTVDRVEVVDDTLRFEGRYSPRDTSTSDTPDILVRGDAPGREPATSLPSSWQGDRFSVGIDVRDGTEDEPGWRPGEGRWDVLLRDGPTAGDLLSLEAAAEVLDVLPVYVRRGDELVTLVDDAEQLAIFVAGRRSSDSPRSTPPAAPRRTPASFTLGPLVSREVAREPATGRATGGHGPAVDAMIRLAERVAPRGLLRRVPPVWRARLVRAVDRVGRLARR